MQNYKQQNCIQDSEIEAYKEQGFFYDCNTFVYKTFYLVEKVTQDGMTY